MNEMTQILGIVAMEPKGEWDSETYYEKLNTVLYNDSTYMATEGVVGEDPSTSDKWQLIGGGVIREETIFTFDTVADMKASTKLKNGMTVQTLGYYTANDGGAATYKITDTANLTDYQEEVGDLYATIVVNDFANVKQFGANGDGTTDDTLALQSAFNSRYNIFIGKGVYVINDELSIAVDKIVEGDSESLIKAKKNMSVNKSIIKLLHNNIRLNGVNISGNIEDNPIGDVYNDNQGITLLKIGNYSNITISECAFKDNAYVGIQIYNNSNSTIKNINIINNVFSNIDCGIISLGSDYTLKDISIINNKIDGHQYSEGISIFHQGYAENIQISNNIINNKYNGNAIYFDRGTFKTINISNNIINCCTNGIRLTNCSYTKVNNNIIKGTSDHKINTGIYLYDNNDNYNITNNIIDYVTNNAINISSSSSGCVKNNNITNINANSSSTYMSGVYINNSNNIYCTNNTSSKYAETNTLVYNINGTIDKLNILELNNNSNVTIGIQMSGLSADITNSQILTNLSINGNFTSTNVDSNTNYFKQIVSKDSVNSGNVELPYRFKFLRNVNLVFSSAKTISTFTIYNLKDYDVYELNVRPNGLVTLTTDSSSDFGITWLSDRTFTTPTQLRIMYYNGKFYEI